MPTGEVYACNIRDAIVLGVSVEDLAATPKAKRGLHLPVVLSVPETAALLDGMHGTARLMARLDLLWRFQLGVAAIGPDCERRATAL